MRNLFILLLFFIIFITTSCNWQLSNSTQVPDQMKKMIFYSSDPNGHLSRVIRKQLRLKGIQLVAKDSLCQDIPSFRVLTSTLDRDTVSIFQDGSTAKYQMVMSVSASILIPEHGIYPISSKVYRSFFNNSQTALAKVTEQQLIINEIYDKAAEELIRKLPSIRLVNKKEATEQQVSEVEYHQDLTSIHTTLGN